MRKAILVTFLSIMMLFTGCSKSGDRVQVPFSYSDCIGMYYTSAIDELEAAGFTNISVSEMTSPFSSPGKVSKITIDGKNSFANRSAYSPDVPVVVYYYVKYEAPPTPTPSPTPDPDQAIANRIGYPLEQYKSMKEALILCGVDESDVQYAMMIGTHEASYVRNGISLTIRFDDDGNCTRIYHMDTDYYRDGEVLRKVFGSLDSVSSADSTDIRSAALSVNEQLFSSCYAASIAYDSFTYSIQSNSFSSNLEAYNSAKLVKSLIEELYLNALQVDCDYDLKYYDDYRWAAWSFLSEMINVCDLSMQYLDNSLTSTLSDFQTSIALVEMYAEEFSEAQTNFLLSAGFSSDEIASILESYSSILDE